MRRNQCVLSSVTGRIDRFDLLPTSVWT